MSEQMFSPVRCNRCHNGIYDLGKVEVTARYTDCSVWRTPCCNQVVDDRGQTGWTSRKDYEVLTQEQLAAHRNGITDIYGNFRRWGGAR
jgi:hypothetical protein